MFYLIHCTSYLKTFKLLLKKLLDSSSYREIYFIGRHTVNYDKVLETVKIPVFMARPVSLNDRSFWKARDYMYFLFFYSVPTIVLSLFYKHINDQKYVFHFLTFLYGCRMCYMRSARSL